MFRLDGSQACMTREYVRNIIFGCLLLPETDPCCLNRTLIFDWDTTKFERDGKSLEFLGMFTGSEAGLIYLCQTYLGYFYI